MRAKRGFPRPVSFVLIAALLPASQTFSGITEKELLAFAQAWRNPQDYVWTRESRSHPTERPNDEIRIKDYGRLRVTFISYEGDSVVLKPEILRHRFETRLPGEPPRFGVSKIEGEKLPLTWLHSITGFSLGVDPGLGGRLGTTHQAAEVLDLLDFRGFVPKEVPATRAEWHALMKRKPDAVFAFEEEISRTFRCESVTVSGEQTRCRVRFEETAKVTPGNPKRSSELRERNGIYIVVLPAGLIERATWEMEATEFFRTEAGRRQIRTVTKVVLQRRDVRTLATKQRKKTGDFSALPPPPR